MTTPRELDEKIEKKWKTEHSRMEAREEIIEEHEDKTITRIYKENIKGKTDVKMRKQDFLYFAKDVRGEEKKGKEERKKYTRHDYREPEEGILGERKKPDIGEYYVTKIKDTDEDEPYFIKYRTRTEFKTILERILAAYDIDKADVIGITTKTKSYGEFKAQDRW